MRNTADAEWAHGAIARMTVQAVALALAGMAFLQTAAGEKTILAGPPGETLAQFSFDEGPPPDALKGWTATPGATLADFGRSGKILCISSCEEERVTGKRPVGQNQAKWTGPSFPVDPSKNKFITVSAWGYAMFSFGQDPSYAGVLSVEWLGKDGQVLQKVPACLWIRDETMAMHEQTCVLPFGIQWSYRQAALQPPVAAAAARLVLHFSKDPGGAVWVDDICVTGGETPDAAADPSIRPTEELDARKTGATARPLDGWLHTPAYGNFFFDDKPLHFDLHVWNPSDPKEEVNLPSNAVIRYRVTDYDYLEVARGEVKAAPQPLSPEMVKKSGYTTPALSPGQRLIPFDLPDAIRRERGRWLVCDVDLVANGQILLQAATPFVTVVSHRKAAGREELWNGHFGGGFFGGWLASSYDFGGWKRTQPERGPFVGMDKTAGESAGDTVLVDSLFYHWSPTRNHEWVPAWALIDAQINPYRFRKEDWLAYVKAVVETHKGKRPMVYGPTGTERAQTDFLMECQRDAAKLINQTDPDARIMFENGDWTDKGIGNLKHWGLAATTDIYDMHIYSLRFDPEHWKGGKKTLSDLRGGKPVRIWCTELAYTGDSSPISKASRIMDVHMRYFNAGIDAIFWYTPEAATVRNSRPVLRERPLLQGNWDHYNLMCGYLRARLSTLTSTDRLAATVATPQPAAVNYYTLIDALEGFESVASLACDESMEALAFQQKNSTVLGLWRKPYRGEAEVWLEGLKTAGGTLIDVLGRHDRVRASGGRLLLTVTENPLLLMLDQRVESVRVKQAGSLFEARAGAQVEVMRGGVCAMALQRKPLEPMKEVVFSARVGEGFQCHVKAGGETIAVQIQTPTDRFPGDGFPVWIELSQAGEKEPFGLLQRRVKFVPPVRIRLDREFVSTSNAVLTVSVKNCADRELRPQVALRAPDMQAALRPEVFTKAFALNGGEETAWRIPVRLASPWWFDFPVQATWTADGAAKGETTRTLNMRPSLRARVTIRLDGDDADWKDAVWVPAIHMSYMMGGNHLPDWRPWKEEWTGPEDAQIWLASQWNGSNLYFAARIQDDKLLLEAKNPAEVYYGDGLHFCLYSGGLEAGDFARFTVYRDYVGGLADGTGSIWRHTGPYPPTSGWPEGAQVGFRRTSKGAFVEWSYPGNAIKPLRLERGQEFRICAAYQDYDEPLPRDEQLDPFMSGPKGQHGVKMRYVHIGDRFIGINHDPLYFAPFELVDTESERQRLPRGTVAHGLHGYLGGDIGRRKRVVITLERELHAMERTLSAGEWTSANVQAWW